jgi:hypothetical protein
MAAASTRERREIRIGKFYALFESGQANGLCLQRDQSEDMLDPDLVEHTDQDVRDCLGHLHLLLS